MAISFRGSARLETKEAEMKLSSDPEYMRTDKDIGGLVAFAETSNKNSSCVLCVIGVT